jgi:SAM-dependent methyltransferase
VRLDDPAAVRAEYASERGLATRKAAHRFGEGPDAREVLVAAVAEVRPATVLDVGCGEGDLGERIARELGATVVGVDQSERMVELTRSRGLQALVGDVRKLPFENATFDCAVAAWMLYHVREVERAVAELARVLRSGGRLVAVTNGPDHLRELWELAGGERVRWSFDGENGPGILAAGFARVERRDAHGWIAFPDRAAAQQYVDASPSLGAGAVLPPFEGPLRVRRTPTVLVADRA